MYLSKNIPSRYRSALAKFRCGVAPLWIETGRYENKNVNERVCFICHDQIEDEKHVLLDCPLYVDLRERFSIHRGATPHLNLAKALLYRLGMFLLKYISVSKTSLNNL
jgi:hypothetical protein